MTRITQQSQNKLEMSSNNQLINFLRRNTFDYCPFCGSELVHWKTKKLEYSDSQEEIDVTVCGICDIEISLSIIGDFSDDGRINHIDKTKLELNIASQTALDAYILAQNQSNEVDYLKSHKTPKDIEDFS